MNTPARFLIAAATFAILATPAFADSDAAAVAALESRIEALQKRVAALESRLSFASFMPNLAERFHVMHRAGEAGDWAVASHELSEVKRLTALSTDVDADKGQLMQSMMQPNLSALDEAIDTSDKGEFAQALNATVATCNACHVATDSGFINVTLNSRDTLSMRHPHTLSMRAAPQEHHHDMPESVTGGMPGHTDADEATPHAHTADSAHTD